MLVFMRDIEEDIVNSLLNNEYTTIVADFAEVNWERHLK